MYRKIKRRAFEIIEKAEKGDTASRIFDIFILALIIVNVLSVFVETFRISESFRAVLYKIEVLSVAIFSVEYLLRVWTADLLYGSMPPFRARLKYIFSFMALIDFFAILPFYIPLVIPVDLRVLRTLRLVRLMRVFKANRYTESLHKVLTVIREKSAELVSAIFMLISSVLIYYIENPIQPDVYTNALSGLWWSIAIFTSVWLGDIYPVTVAGRILCAVMAILGVAIIAVPTGIISSGFVENSDEADDEKLRLLKKLESDFEELKEKLKK